MNRMMTIEIRDYDPGTDPDPLTTARIERVVERMLEKDGSDGYVIVTESDKEQQDG